MHHRRDSHAAVVLNNGKVLVTGGIFTEVFPLHAVELYDPSTGNWTDAGNMPMELEWHTASVLKDGNVLVSGGNQYGVPVNTAELYNPHGIKNQ